MSTPSLQDIWHTHVLSIERFSMMQPKPKPLSLLSPIELWTMRYRYLRIVLVMCSKRRMAFSDSVVVDGDGGSVVALAQAGASFCLCRRWET